VKKHGTDFLGSAYQRSEESINELEAMVGEHEKELAETRRRIAEARETLEEQRVAAGIHLDELLKEILGESERPLSDFLNDAKKANAAATAAEKPRVVASRPAKRSEARGTAGWLASWLGK
jgi:peptidoglycan hydrolase CwlO-like protein